jgi:putative nucleotidyltransferase with HDIG domain
MLKTANTAYFSRRVPVETLGSAVTYLGLEGIRQLLLHEMFASFTKLFANQRDRLAHMRRCSHLASYIGKLTKANIPTIGKIRVAGLMHDIGSLAYSFYDEQKYAQVLRMVRGEKMTIAEAEHKVFGVDHTYLGALYAREIGMPDYVISVIKQHHSVEAESDDMILNAVAAANGFLNERIEQVPCDDFDHLFSFIAQKINENDPAYKAAASRSDRDAEEESEDQETEEIVEELQAGFKPMQLYGLLKEELDQFMMSGANAQGF